MLEIMLEIILAFDMTMPNDILPNLISYTFFPDLIMDSVIYLFIQVVLQLIMNWVLHL